MDRHEPSVATGHLAVAGIAVDRGDKLSRCLALGGRCDRPTRHQGRTAVSDHEAIPSVTADDAWARLLAGNERFRAGQARRAPSAAELAELSRGQHPFATIL